MSHLGNRRPARRCLGVSSKIKLDFALSSSKTVSLPCWTQRKSTLVDRVMTCLAMLLCSVCQPVHAQIGVDGSIESVSNTDCGIDFVHTDGGCGKRYIMESVIGSLALFDYDGDGLVDIYFMNGAPLQGTQMDPPPSNRLYRNLGDWRFRDVTQQAGVGDLGYGMGVVVGDYDQDGDADLFMSNYGHNVLYANNGDGTFVDATLASGLAGPSRFGAGNSFFDMDGDGDLDLYCASYVQFEYSDYKIRTIAGHAFHTGPIDYLPAGDFLYRNESDGHFTDVTQQAGLGDMRAPGMGVLAADFDDDGDQDVFVANDQQANFMLMNDGQGHFHDDAILAGVAFDRKGKANGNMGVEYADLNGDHLAELVCTSYQDEMPVLYQALGMGYFNDATNVARLDPALHAHVNWGIGVVDFDNDADRDLYIACGHFLDNIRFIDDRTDVKVRDYLLANDGRGHFTNMTNSAGSLFARIESSRAAGFDDLDNDGDIDVVVLNFNASPSLGRTLAPPQNRSLQIKLVGTLSNRDGLGSQLKVIDSADREQRSVTFSGRGYESYYGSAQHFGFGHQGQGPIDIQVQWPSGTRENFTARDVQPGEYSTVMLIEGQGQPADRLR